MQATPACAADKQMDPLIAVLCLSFYNRTIILGSKVLCYVWVCKRTVYVKKTAWQIEGH